MAVGKGRHISFRGVRDQFITSRYGSLSPGVSDLFTIREAGEAGDDRCPAVIGVQGDLCTIREGSGDGLRTDAVGIILIVPDLLDRQVDRRRFVRVGHGKAEGGGTGIAYVITVDLIFLYAVGDCTAVFVEREAVEGILPVILFRKDECLSGIFIPNEEPDGDGFRTEAVLIVRVVPNLFDRDIDLAGGYAYSSA